MKIRYHSVGVIGSPFQNSGQSEAAIRKMLLTRKGNQLRSGLGKSQGSKGQGLGLVRDIPKNIVKLRLAVLAFSICTIAVVLSCASVSTHQPFFKRVFENQSRAISCFARFFISGLWTADCIVATSVDFGLSKSFETDTLTLDFTGPDSSPVLVSFAKISANLLPIPGYNWPITQVRVHGVILDNGVILARIEPPWALTTINDGLLSLHTATSPKERLISPSSFRFLGPKVINGISFTTPVTFAGCNGLPDIHFLSIISVDSAPTAMTVTMSSIVLSPGQVQFIMEDIVLQMFSKE
ncbi:hypothetical protein KVV02_000682, partial [Mortierella alpina]